MMYRSTCLLALCLMATAVGAEDKQGSSKGLSDGVEVGLQLHELAVAAAESEASLAATEVAKIRQEMEYASQDADERQARMLSFELKKAEIQLELRHLALKMKHLEFAHHRAQVEATEKKQAAMAKQAIASQTQVKAAIDKVAQTKRAEKARASKSSDSKRKEVAEAKRRTPTPVHLEVNDELDIVVIRGPKESVERVKALIQKARQAKQ